MIRGRRESKVSGMERLLSGSDQEYCSIPPRRPAKRSGAVVYLNISIRGKREKKVFWEKVRKIWSKKLIVTKNVGIEVNENGKTGRGGKAWIARGEVGVCTGRGRNCTGASWNRTRDLGGLWTVFSTEKALYGCFSGKSARKWVSCGEVGGGFCTMARNGRFFGREFRRGFVQTVPVSLRSSALFCGRPSLSAA